ncbi:hypothetical protein KA001_00315 [Patescibacteria group bacterium]|nr:hypothetical protein [Patescibacteria group bacterium]
MPLNFNVGNIYIFLGFVFFSFLVFTIKVFFVLQREGFNKENSLDTLIISNSVLALSVFLISDFSFESISYFVTSYTFLLSFLFSFIFLYIKAKFSNWSFLKLLDVFSLYYSALYGYVLIVLSLFSQNKKIGFLGVVFTLFYWFFKRNYKEKYNNSFIFFKITKNYELTLIGLCFYFFLTYFGLLLSLTTIVFDKPINLGLLFFDSVIIIYAIFRVVKITKFFSLKWNYNFNLLKNRGKFLRIRRKKLISRLSD